MAQNVVAVETPLTTKILRYWLPVLVMLGLMYYLSTDVFSGDNTRGVIESILRWIWPQSANHISKINFVVRKSMHFMEYAVLAGLVYRAFRADGRGLWRFKWALYSFLTIVSWALLDELHQMHTRNRGGSINDSMIDSAGGLTMLLAIATVSYLRGARSASDHSRNNQ